MLLEGRVTSAAGSAIAGARVSVADTATGTSREVLTRADGEFLLLALTSGSYRVTVSAPGFQGEEQRVDLGVGQRPRLRFTLRDAAITLAPIEVRAVGPAAAELRRPSVSAPVSERDIRELPLATRDALDLAALVPGIRSYQPSGGHNVPAAGALRGERFLNVYLDGVELKNLYDGGIVGFPQDGSPFSPDALREFRVYLQPYDPAFARAAAYAIDAVTQRGTNQMQGTAFGFIQPRGLVAANDFLRAVPNFLDADFERQQAGVSLRGPLRRDRLFFAASYELSNAQTFITVVPGQPAAAPGIWDDFAGLFAAPRRNHMGLLRLTWDARPGHTFDFTGSTRHLESTGRFGGRIAYASAVRDRHTVHTLGFRHRWLPTPALGNELGLQLVAWNNTGRALFPQSSLQYPGIDIGAPASEFEIQERHVRLIDRLTHAFHGRSGSHVTTAGIELAGVRVENFAPFLALGRFSDFASDTATLPGEARIGVGWRHPDSERDARAAIAGFVTGVYLHHEWQPAARLTLGFGLRHDADLGLLNNDIAVPWTEDPELTGRPELRRYLNRGADRRNDMNNFSPRFSFSWDVAEGGNTVLRGGLGIIYDRIPAFIAFQERHSALWRTYVFDAPGTVDPAVLRERVASGEQRLAAVTLIANDMEVPQNRQWSVGVGRRITPALLLSLDYVSQDVRDLFAELNLNWLDRSVTPARRALTERYGDIVVWDDFARARYRALLGRLNWDPAPDFRLALAYTLASARADWDAANQSVPAAAASRYYTLQRISGDERHRLVLSGVLPLPWRTRLSLVATAASPRPYRSIHGQDLNANSFLFDDWSDDRRYRLPADRWRNWYRALDVRLAHTIGAPPGVRGTVIAEVFNVLNSENYSAFQGRQHTLDGREIANFGEPAGVFGTRRLQLGARVEF